MSPHDATTTVAPGPDAAAPPAAEPREETPPGAAAPSASAEEGLRDLGRAERDERSFDLGRMAWLATVLSLLLAVSILVLNGYVGYAGVTLAVALAAAINLL